MRSSQEEDYTTTSNQSGSRQIEVFQQSYHHPMVGTYTHAYMHEFFMMRYLCVRDGMHGLIQTAILEHPGGYLVACWFRFSSVRPTVHECKSVAHSIIRKAFYSCVIESAPSYSLDPSSRDSRPTPCHQARVYCCIPRATQLPSHVLT